MKSLTFEESLDIALTQRQISLASGGKPRKIKRREVEEAFLEAFELVGGISRLAIWANNPANYGDFLKLYSKMIPKEMAEDAGQTFVYMSNVPASALNKPAVTTRIDEREVGDGPSSE